MPHVQLTNERNGCETGTDQIEADKTKGRQTTTREGGQSTADKGRQTTAREGGQPTAENGRQNNRM